MKTNPERRNLVDQKTLDDISAQVDQAIKDIKTLSDNAVLSAAGEAVGVGKVAASTIQTTQTLVEGLAFSLFDAMAAAFDEAAGAISKLKKANERFKTEVSELSDALVGIKRKKSEIDDYSESLKKLNEQISLLKVHIDSGFFSVAERCAKAIQE